jgi:N-acetylneuraminic acid mutarotase
MKKIENLIFCLLLFFAVRTSAQLPNTWVQKANIGTFLRDGATGLCIGTKGYVGFGHDPTVGIFRQDFWEYDPANNTWTQKANIPGVGRMDVVSFSIGTKGYVGTGFAGTGRLADFYEYNPATNSWTAKADFGGGQREDAVGFSIGSKGYIGTGIDGTGITRQDFWEYNPATNVWIQKAQVGGGVRQEAIGLSIGSKGYIGLGATPLKQDFWEYDPSTDVWIQKANFGGTARYISTAFSINSRGYVGTGYDGTYTDDIWEYDPALNSWELRTNFPGGGRWNVASFSIGEKGYCGTGRDAGGVSHNDFYEYTPAIVVHTGSISGNPFCYNDPLIINYTLSGTVNPGNIFTAQLSNSTGSFASPLNLASVVSTASGSISTTIPFSATVGTGYRIRVISSSPAGIFFDNGTDLIIGSSITTNVWTQKANFTGTARRNAVAFNIGSKAYIGTGNDGAYKKDFWEYSPSTDSWTQKADFGGVARAEACGFSIDNKGYIGTGYDGTYKNDFWEYDQPSNTWTQKANLTATGRRRAVGINIDSKGYIGTGENGSDKNDFWEYNPATNTWTQKTNFPGGTRSDAVALSIGSKGYVGTGNNGFVVSSDWYEYNPAQNSWTSKSSMLTARSNAVGFSLGNKGYVVSGGDILNSAKNDLSEFDPATNSWTLKASIGAAPTSRLDAVGFAIDGRGYIATGSRNGTSRNDVFVYEPIPTILTQVISPLSFCSGSPINVPYSAGGSYQCGNKFIAQLSDPSGNFSSPVNIGEISSTISGTINATLPTNATTGIGYRIRVISYAPDISGNTNTSNNSNNITITNCPVTLQLNVLLQCFYSGNGLMNNFGSGGCLYVSGVSANPLYADTITVSIMDAAPPHNEIDHQKGVLSTSGNITVSFNPTVVAYRSHFIKINHRNSIETWSQDPVLLLPNANYSFTTSASKAFSSNEALTFDNFGYAIYSGDINNDGAVDGSDFLDLIPAVINGDGGYAIGDVNGDGSVDGGDFLSLDINIQNGIGSVTP